LQLGLNILCFLVLFDVKLSKIKFLTFVRDNMVIQKQYGNPTTKVLSHWVRLTTRIMRHHLVVKRQISWR